MSSILDITESIPSDTRIDDYEYVEYGTIVGTNLNNFGGDIRITIETQDIFTHPSESVLIIEGQLTKNDDTLYADSDAVSLINNGMMYLFKDIKYLLSEKVLEQLQYPGQATTMLGLLKYPDDFSKSHGINQLWYKDTGPTAHLVNNSGFGIRHYIIQKPNPKGAFSFKVPLKHIFGFCEDYNKILYGMKQALTLTRNNDNDAIFRAGGPADGKIKLDKISWYMPHVMPADKPKMDLYKIIERKETLPVGYRMIHCSNASVPQTISFTWHLPSKSSPEVQRFIIVGFQTNKSNNQRQNPAIFNNVGVNNIYVKLNSKKYPTADYNISFPRQKVSRAYGDAALFWSKFFNMDVLVSNFNFTPLEFTDLYPLFVFDVTKQSERLKYSITNIQIKAFFDNNVDAGTEVYAVIISDRLINFESNGNRLSVVIQDFFTHIKNDEHQRIKNDT